jgi:hypothetical protein
MTKKELLKILTDKKIKEDTEIKILCTTYRAIPVETAYFDKSENQFIIETN